jgi:hypothetical protein
VTSVCAWANKGNIEGKRLRLGRYGGADDDCWRAISADGIAQSVCAVRTMTEGFELIGATDE